MPLHFELVTPERIVFKTDADRVTLPTAEGEITVLPNHVPLVARLVAGVATLVVGGVEEDVAVSGGFIEIGEGNSVRVLADTAERGTELDISVIEAATERATEVMKNVARTDDNAYAAAAAAMERELARGRVARRVHVSRRIPTLDAANLPHDKNPL
ncbi:MAG: ATP synthase F1 subunit epsilon [Patescibacteria group bacterium]